MKVLGTSTCPECVKTNAPRKKNESLGPLESDISSTLVNILLFSML